MRMDLTARVSHIPPPGATLRARRPDRGRAMDKPTISKPIIVAQFFKNRRKDIVRVALSEYEGHPLIDISQCFTDPKDGRVKATKKGVAIHIRRLPDLAKAINKAERKARELGLIDEASDE